LNAIQALSQLSYTPNTAATGYLLPADSKARPEIHRAMFRLQEKSPDHPTKNISDDI
jgi:hypothetical protein